MTSIREEFEIDVRQMIDNVRPVQGDNLIELDPVLNCRKEKSFLRSIINTGSI